MNRRNPRKPSQPDTPTLKTPMLRHGGFLKRIALTVRFRMQFWLIDVTLMINRAAGPASRQISTFKVRDPLASIQPTGDLIPCG